VPRVSHTESTAANIAARSGALDDARPLVSVIVVNWNGLAYLPECLGSLALQSYPALEIVVVDNGSTDGSLEYLRRDHGERVRLVESPANTGFAGGNNLGIRAAKGDYLALINNDAAADARWVEALVAAAESDPRVGMCASKIYVWDRPGVLDGAGLLLSGDGIGRVEQGSTSVLGEEDPTRGAVGSFCRDTPSAVLVPRRLALSERPRSG